MTDALLAMTLLGPLALRIGAARQKLPFAGQTKRLFVYLAGHANISLRRDILLEELWPDVVPARAQSGLNTAIWRIKQGLKPYAGFAVRTFEDLVRLSVESPVQIDAQQLERAVTEVPAGALRPEDHDRLLTSVSLCRGPYLDGCSDHWVLPLREKFAALHIRALTLLMRDQAARGDYDAALDHGRRILELDGFREGTQREVIWLYALNGQRAQAIKQYHDLARLLDQELGIDPMPETVALYRNIAHAQDSVVRIAADMLRERLIAATAVPAVCLALAGETVSGR